MFHMSNDSGLFRTREELIGDGWELRGNVFTRDGEWYLPLYEAKLFHQYDHRFATFDGVPAQAIRSGNARAMTSDEKADPETVVLPRYWVPEEDVMKRLDKSELTLFEPILDRLAEVGTQLALRNGSHQRADKNLRHDPERRPERLRNNHSRWIIVFRDIARATDQRTSIFAAIQGTAVGNSAPVIDYEGGRAIASSFVLANMNSLPLDWAVRFSVGGTHMNFFIVKQLPVLPPEAYLEEVRPGLKFAELVVPRVLELTYTADDLQGFARDLGYQGPPFPWEDRRRHILQCELDAIFAHIYELDRSELEWILDAPPPSSSFPALKRNEVSEFGEYRTQRYVLQAYDQLERGEIPNFEGASA